MSHARCVVAPASENLKFLRYSPDIRGSIAIKIIRTPIKLHKILKKILEHHASLHKLVLLLNGNKIMEWTPPWCSSYRGKFKGKGKLS